jgi:hypothetical protein
MESIARASSVNEVGAENSEAPAHQEVPKRRLNRGAKNAHDETGSDGYDKSKSITNEQGRLGLSPQDFAKAAIVQNLRRAFHCTPHRQQKEYLLRLCMGSFTREEVNTLIVKPPCSDFANTDTASSSKGKRRGGKYEHVSKVWWRNIRCLPEEELGSLFSKRSLTQTHPSLASKRSRTASDNDTATNHRMSLHQAFPAMQDPLFLQEAGRGLLSFAMPSSLPSSSLSADACPQFLLSAEGGRHGGQGTHTSATNDSIAADERVHSYYDYNSNKRNEVEGGGSVSEVGGACGGSADNIDHDDRDDIEEVEEGDNGGDEYTRLVDAYIQEDEVNFDFDE